jgi:hypothetical protein
VEIIRAGGPVRRDGWITPSHPGPVVRTRSIAPRHLTLHQRPVDRERRGAGLEHHRRVACSTAEQVHPSSPEINEPTRDRRQFSLHRIPLLLDGLSGERCGNDHDALITGASVIRPLSLPTNGSGIAP